MHFKKKQMEEEVFDIELLTNRPKLVSVTQAQLHNEVLMAALKDLPSGISFEEQKKLFCEPRFQGENFQI